DESRVPREGRREKGDERGSRWTLSHCWHRSLLVGHRWQASPLVGRALVSASPWGLGASTRLLLLEPGSARTDEVLIQKALSDQPIHDAGFVHGALLLKFLSPIVN